MHCHEEILSVSRQLPRVFLFTNIVRALSLPKTPSAGVAGCSRIRTQSRLMIAIAFLFVRMVCDCFKSRRRLDAELLVLRHQLNVLRQRAPRRLYLSCADRALFVWLYKAESARLDPLGTAGSARSPSLRLTPILSNFAMCSRDKNRRLWPSERIAANTANEANERWTGAFGD